MTAVGILALQGDVAEHRAMIAGLGAEPIDVKRRDQLDSIDGLVIPGGESTTIGKLLLRFDMLDRLRERVQEGLPVYGTCAGMILLADRVTDAAVDQPTVGGMDITVRRNAFGRQRESFETDLQIPVAGADPVRAVFIRAPVIQQTGPDVDVLALLPDGRPVAARQGNKLVSSFHPELAGDYRMHAFFLRIVENRS